MQRTLFNISWIIMMLVWGCSKAPLPPESGVNLQNNGVGILKISTVNSQGLTVDSTKIFLNGDFIGYSPVSVNSLSFGIHTLRAQKQGYELYSENITIENNLPVNKEIILHNLPINTGQLLITINQDSAKTTITSSNNEIINQAEVRELLLTLDTGGYFIRCEKSGYTLVLKAIEIKVDTITIENIHLQKLEHNSLPQVAIVVPDSGRINEPVLISWESANANNVDIDYIENPGLNGKREVNFQSTGKHYIKATAYNQIEQVCAVDSIFIYKVPNVLPTIKVTVSPDRIYANEVVTIGWRSTNATEVAVDYVPSPGLSGQWQERFYNSGTIIVYAYAYGPGGQAQDVDTIQVVDIEPPALDFSVDREVTAFSKPIILSWNTDGYQVIIDHGVGTQGPVGSDEITFENPGNKTITAVAYGEDNLTTIKRVSVLVLEPEQPQLPVLSLSVIDSVEVGQPALFEWHSWNATAVDVDHVQNSGLNGKAEVIFQSPGMRIITATAYNNAGQVTVTDTLIVVNTPVAPQVESILIPSGAMVCAVHPSGLQEWKNAGEAMVEVAGYYRVTAAAWYNSGDDQKNESFFINLINEQNIEQTPLDPNAGIYKVVPDDPGPPHVAERNAGTFYFSQGKNIISLYHYYTISDRHPQFIVNSPITDAESIQVLYFKLEYIKEHLIVHARGIQ